MAEQTRARTKKSQARESTGTMQELFLGLVWFGTSMWAAYVTIKNGGAGPSGALGDAAAALPGVVAATLVTGASLGNAAGGRFSSAGGRLFAGLGMGVLFGLVAAAGIRFAYGSDAAITSLAIVVAISSVVGGALAILPGSVLEAGLWATSWVFFAGVILGVLQMPLSQGLGDDALVDPTFVMGQSVLTGLFGSWQAYGWLRRQRHAVGWYAIVGALPGVVLLLAEVLTRLGDSAVPGIVTGNSDGQVAPVETNAVRHALIVLAIGVVLTTIAGLRNNRREDAEARAEADDSDDSDADSDDD
jgi:hypothetical protein